MASLVLDECVSCQRLPPIGLLPLLKVLKITKLDEIVSIDGDFHGNNSSSFKSLETLEFFDMSGWEKWDFQGVTNAFPRLRHLSIRNCSKLKGQLPEQLIPLERLHIEDCHQLEASAPRALDLQLRHCGKLQLDWGTMKRLRMKRSKLEIVGSSNTLQNLHIDLINDDCVSLQSFPLDLFPTLRTLHLRGFGNLEMISQSLVHNHIESLTLKYCPKLESFPGSMHMLLPSLKRLWIQDCPRLELFPEGGFPSNLQILMIQGCSVLESFPDIGFPSNLHTLSLIDCPRLKLFPNRCFSSNLQTLRIEGCLVLEWFPDGGFPSNIKDLTIKDCPRLNRSLAEVSHQISRI